MNTALMAPFAKLPEQLRKMLTRNRGKDCSEHARFTLDTGTIAFVVDRQSPWRRPTNENTDGPFFRHYSKGTDLSRWSADFLATVNYALSKRQRRPLGWQPPTEEFAEQHQSIQLPNIATTV